jgi:hypothetical protein
LKANPEEIESETDHREVPKEDAVVKPVAGLRKRHRGWNLAAGRRGEPKELNRGDCGSRRKLAAACRKVSRRARIARNQRGVARRDCIRTNVKQRIRRVRTLRERVQTLHEDRKGMKDLGGGCPRYLKKQALKKLQRESTGNAIKTDRKTTGLGIAKRIARSPVGLRRM